MTKSTDEVVLNLGKVCEVAHFSRCAPSHHFSKFVCVGSDKIKLNKRTIIVQLILLIYLSESSKRKICSYENLKKL